MASYAVVNAVRTRVQANWTHTTFIDFNVTGISPPTGDPFLVLQFPVSNENQISTGQPGNQVWRESGAFRLVLNMRRAVGIDLGLQWMDELRSLFRGQKFSGVNTWAPSPPMLDDGNDLGNYYTLASVVPYYFDILA